MPKLSREDDPAIQQREHSTVWRDGEVSTFLYEKTRRYDVHKGAQCANVKLPIRSLGRNSGAANQVRGAFTDCAIREATRAYTERFGVIEWDIARINIWHSTASVIVELIVEPD